jgi:hypothetical protein
MTEIRNITEKNVSVFEIFPNAGGNPISFAGGIAELHYYENILSETVRMTIAFVDTGNASDGDDGSGGRITASNKIKISRGEKVYIDFEDGLGQKVSFKTDDNALYITQRDKGSDKLKEIEIIELVSKEYLKNESIRLKKRYDGKISDSIEKIIKSGDEGFKTTKEVDIEPTKNERSFIATIKKPFYFVMWLASQSIKEGTSALGLLAGYFFFETKSGYKFKSVDGLLEQEYTKKYIFNNTVSDPPPGYTGKILNVELIDDNDLKDQLQMGTYNSSVNLFNSFESTFNCTPLDISRQVAASSSQATEYGQNMNPEFIGDPSRLYSSLKSIGNLKSVEKSKELDTVKEDYLSASSSRYNQLFTVKLSITIGGDFSLEAGQLIYCDFPEQTTKVNINSDPRISGVYLISSLHHYIQPNKNCYTYLEIIREASGRKPMKTQ